METNHRQYDAFEELLAQIVAENVDEMLKIQSIDVQNN